MTLISLLIALAVERVTVKSPYWHYDFYFSRYLDLIEKQGWGKDTASMTNVVALSLIPAIIIGLLNQVVLGFFIEYAVQPSIVTYMFRLSYATSKLQRVLKSRSAR
jgi:hypothetical protein